MTCEKLNPYRWSGDAGQALVEAALCMFLLILLLLGAAEFGRLAYASIEVANAARAGAAYAMQNSGTASDTAGILTAAQNDAPNLNGLTATSSISCICSNGNSASCTDNTACTTPVASHVVETVTVNTQATVDPLIHVPGLPTTYTLKGKAVQKCLQ